MTYPTPTIPTYQTSLVKAQIVEASPTTIAFCPYQKGERGRRNKGSNLWWERLTTTNKKQDLSVFRNCVLLLSGNEVILIYFLFPQDTVHLLSQRTTGSEKYLFETLLAHPEKHGNSEHCIVSGSH